MLGREEWDLFACAFGEGQCSGHQFWHFLEAGPPHGDARSDGEAIRSVYERLDSALGATRSTPQATGVTVFAVASHSFVGRRGGKQLIPEVLVRLGYGSGGGSIRASTIESPARACEGSHARCSRARRRRRCRRKRELSSNPLESPQTRAAALDGDRCSWIRLNLKGREPQGSVEPGAEAACDPRRHPIRAPPARTPDTGERIVERSRARRKRSEKTIIPTFPTSSCTSERTWGRSTLADPSRVGVVHAPFELVANRTSGHPALPSYLWVSGPDVSPGQSVGAGDTVDLAPTMLAHLGVTQPYWVDGQPLGI